MRTRATRLIFSDVDGTILDARYRHRLTPPELDRALARGPVVLVSGRTLDELAALADELGHALDLIGENGSFIATHNAAIAGELESRGHAIAVRHGRFVAELAIPRARTRTLVGIVLDAEPSETVIADELSALVFAELSGYDLACATRALHREYSVLLDRADPHVSARLRHAGLEASFGGRWLTVTHGSTKGRAVLAYQAAASLAVPVRSVAIGDAGNDYTMLQAVDHAFVVRRAALGHALALAAIPGARLLSRPGSEGWLEMVEILEQEDRDA